MKLYLTAAGVYAGTQVEAKADGKGWTPEEVPVDKQGLIQYLNALVLKHTTFADLADDDATNSDIETHTTPPAALAKLNEGVSEPTSRSIQMDEEWDRLSLARQLDFAARAMENARAAL